MSDDPIYPVPAEFAAQANISAAQYDEMYQQSVEDPEGFWSEQAENYLSWFKPWNSVCDWSFDEQDLHIKWFSGGELNVSYNCLDRHLETRGDQVAIIWESDNPEKDRMIEMSRPAGDDDTQSFGQQQVHDGYSSEPVEIGEPSKRSKSPFVYTKEHVGFGPITVEAKTANAPLNDPDDQ